MARAQGFPYTTRTNPGEGPVEEVTSSPVQTNNDVKTLFAGWQPPVHHLLTRHERHGTDPGLTGPAKPCSASLMVMSTAELIAHGEEHTRDLPFNPWALGAVVLAILMVLLIGVLMFGKGRPHA